MPKSAGAVRVLVLGALLTLSIGAWRSKPVVTREDVEIATRDDCDPNDPAWLPTGGCALEDGAVNAAQFFGAVVSPLSLSTVGHPAWRMEPSYIRLGARETARVGNTGGRIHTFTEVSNFGGGRVPALNQGLMPAPECAHATDLPAGALMQVRGLAAGDHRFQCCIHPWMRALIKVTPDD